MIGSSVGRIGAFLLILGSLVIVAHWVYADPFGFGRVSAGAFLLSILLRRTQPDVSNEAIA